jgi:phenylacetic acid degradation operon negative regulatory protein
VEHVAELERYRWTPAAVDVPFLLGALGAETLTGPALIRLLGGLGRGESAARNLLTRMCELGALEAELRGRTNVYRLAAPSTSRYREVEGTAAPTAWTGTFHALLYVVPEQQRSLRDRLQHAAQSAGYGQLRAGVLIAADDRWSRMRLQDERFGGEAWLRRVTLAPADLADAREMAREAWNLDDLARRYERALARCADVPVTVDAGWSALRLWRDLYDVFFAAQLADPHLPAELLPDAWPEQRFAAAQHVVNARIGNALLPLLRGHADQHDAVGGNAYYPPPWARDDRGGVRTSDRE